jgi:hypothetical protein
MLDTTITITLEHRAREKALAFKADLDSLNETGMCKVLIDIKRDKEVQYESLTKDILDYEQRKHRIEDAFTSGLITYDEAQHLLEHDAVDTFFK